MLLPLQEEISFDDVFNAAKAEIDALSYEPKVNCSSADDAEVILGQQPCTEPYSASDNNLPAEEVDRLVSGIEEQNRQKLTEYDAARTVMLCRKFLIAGHSMYLFDKGIYRRTCENEAIAVIKECFPEEVLQRQNTAFWSGVVRQIKSTKSLFLKENKIPKPKRLILFRFGSA